MNPPQRRRRRPAVACIPCRKRKIRCNREMPCSNCTRARNTTCAYETLSPPPSPRRRIVDIAPSSRSSQKYPSPVSIHDSGAIPPPSTGSVGATPRSSTRCSSANDVSLSEYEALKTRIRHLEERLSSRSQAPHEEPPATMNNSIIGTFYVHRQHQSHDQEFASNSVMHKGRVFGQSHWLNSFVLLRDMFEMMELHMRGEKSTALISIERCKYLARIIKDQRAPHWPSPPTTELPSRDVCDNLVDCYLQTTESVYRILHIPSFKQEYDALWNPSANPAPGFLIQLKLVLAIGATVYDDTYTLRTSAVRWIYQAQAYLSEPEFKSRLTIQSLQIHILLLFARQTANIGGTLVWISAGELLRTAVFMGLHKDPSRVLSASRFVSEMHRRLWGTILEIVLQTSLDSGGPALISLAEFDTLPPRNFPDDHLLDENAVPAPDVDFTETSIARALRGAFPIRLAIVRYLNDLESKGTYEEALRLDKELRASHKTMTRTLEAVRLHAGHASPDLGLTLVNFIMASYISAVHSPFLGTAFREPAYAFSRIALLQNSLKLWPAVFPTSTFANHAAPASDIWRRFTICNHRIFHVVVKRACVAIVMELRAQLEDEESLGAAPFRGDLLDTLHEMKVWAFECVKAGETNIKSYVAASLIAAYIEGLRKGLVKDELSKYLVQAAGDSADACLPLLQTMLGKEQGEGGDGLQADLPTPSEGMDWGDIFPFGQMSSEIQDGLGTWGPLGWVLDEESAGGSMGW